MSMYFYDETDDWPEYQIVKADVQRLEKELLEIQIKLNKAESVFRAHPEDKGLGSEIGILKEKIKGIEKRLEESIGLYR